MLSDAVEVKNIEESTGSVLGAEMAPEVPKELTDEEKAAEAVKFLHQAIPSARSQVNNLTGVQAKRVLMSLIESPLEQTTPAFTTLEAHKLFNLACIIQNAKYLLFQTAPALMSQVEKEAAEEQAKKDAAAEAANNSEKESE